MRLLRSLLIGSRRWISVCMVLASLRITMPVQALSNDVVISGVYGGGGNSGAVFTNDYIELYNTSSTAINVTKYGSSSM